jgi:hypothetical protein
MALAEDNGEPYVSLLQPPPGQHAPFTYSERGVIRDGLDACLAGLVLALIQKVERLPRQQLMDVLILMAQPKRLLASVGAENAQTLTEYLRDGNIPCEASRLADGRVHNWLRHFESAGLIRMEARGDLLVAVTGQSIPGYLSSDQQVTDAAVILLRAVEQMQAAGEEMQQIGNPSARQG